MPSCFSGGSSGSANISGPCGSSAIDNGKVALWRCGKPPRPEIDNSASRCLLEAFQAGSLGYTFGGGGFLFGYHAGVYKSLLNLGLVKPGDHVGGASAGSLVAACISCGIPPDQLILAVKEVAAACENKVFGNLGPALKRQLDKILPEDAYLRCSHTTHVGLTQIRLPGLGVVTPKVVSHFKSNSDLKRALLCSCHFPFLSSGSPMACFKGRVVVDGGFSVMFPLPPQPMHVVKVACQPMEVMEDVPMAYKVEALSNVQIRPGLNPWPWTINQSQDYAMKPGGHEFIDKCIEMGARDVVTWATQKGLMALLPAGSPGRPAGLPGRSAGLPGRLAGSPDRHVAGGLGGSGDVGVQQEEPIGPDSEGTLLSLVDSTQRSLRARQADRDHGATWNLMASGGPLPHAAG